MMAKTHLTIGVATALLILHPSNAIDVYETIVGEFEKWIARAKEKATSELLDEANAWREDDSLPEYTEESFMPRIRSVIKLPRCYI